MATRAIGKMEKENAPSVRTRGSADPPPFQKRKVNWRHEPNIKEKNEKTGTEAPRIT
jgi:hypothetical protein